MIRFKPGAPRGVRPRLLSRVRSLAVPTAWGAVAVVYRLTCPLARDDAIGARLVSSAVLCAVGTGIVLHIRRRMLREVRHARRIAEAAQSVLLRPPPPRVDGLAVAAVHLSADRGARIGGDLYEVTATEHGVRAVIGDVRGHGLGAVRTGAAVLGSFREAAHDEPDLAGVLRRLERALDRHLRERAHGEHDTADGAGTPAAEEFVTVLLLEILPDGEVRALNCGHPWPYVLTGAGAEPLALAEPLPPLGPFPLPGELPASACGRLLPGDTLVLHTDGAEEARDAEGRFFPLRDVLAEAARERPQTPQAVLRTVLAALLRHTVGPPKDDVALLILRNERCSPSAHQSHGVTRSATADR
ncbi:MULTISPECIES: PP2C family protein-serine/threonine phosphatase [unclassified Streptomyces]|uniref:PP2C family protein-serine/threonine phosphatase n=1 Tax=unclassified Streptomyces TaxID=2593676 RepID=UPI001E56E48D|nr:MULTISPECIES: PP2C family protein-serine/threonine phosphatase [unclassified Streptomyces]MDU0304417.1 PP2C family protein-serine/threonine phosphatase [Streptomyces sp. PAL114]